ncbi:hypothetical protein UlMin_013047 [Ulmus minor]
MFPYPGPPLSQKALPIVRQIFPFGQPQGFFVAPILPSRILVFLSSYHILSLLRANPNSCFGLNPVSEIIRNEKDEAFSCLRGWKFSNDGPEFEEAAFSAPLNKVVRCKTKFGWHLLQVLSEREESLLQEIQLEELHSRMQDPNFLDEAQLIDVQEPNEVFFAGFQVLPLQQFGSWGPEITSKFDPQKDTYVMCHHGMRSLQVAKWLQMQVNGYNIPYDNTFNVLCYSFYIF